MRFIVLMALVASAVHATPTKNIVQLAESVPELSTLVTAVKAAGLASALSGPAPILTVFAPTNDAFSHVPPAVLQCFLKNPTELAELLKYHVVAGNYSASSLHDHEQLLSIDMQHRLLVTIRDKKVFINHAEVLAPDNEATNGVVHIISEVLIPDQPLSCLNPSADSETVENPTQNIVEIAEATPELSTLVAAVKAGGLASVLSGSGPFTVFAPTNDAFAKVPSAALNCLLQPANRGQLDSILLFHVVGKAAVTSSDLRDGELIKTLEGTDVQAHVHTYGIFIDQAQVITPNVEATNGIVHIINAVLVPTNVELPCLAGTALRGSR